VVVRIFRFFRLSRPRAPLQKFSLNIENISLNKMSLGHLGQLDGIRCDKRSYKVLQLCILMAGIFLKLYRIFIFQTHILNSSSARSLVSGVFWDLLLFLSSFSAILLGDVIAQKNERFTKSVIMRPVFQCVWRPPWVEDGDASDWNGRTGHHTLGVPGTALYTDFGCTSCLPPGGWATVRRRVQYRHRFG